MAVSGGVAAVADLLARSSENGTNPCHCGASPEGACRVGYCGAASRHTKVLPGREGFRVWDQVGLSGPRGGLGRDGPE